LTQWAGSSNEVRIAIETILYDHPTVLSAE
jgi:hypothetical protein